MTESDLIIACGARFSDRVTGLLSGFAPKAQVIHIDIDPAEIGKVRDAQIPIVGDVKGVLAGVVAELNKRDAQPITSDWVKQTQAWKTRWPLYHPDLDDDPATIIPEVLLSTLSGMLDPQKSIIVTEVGQHQMWAAQIIKRDAPRSFITSGGLGTMGFGFPASIGAAMGCPEKTVVCVAGDGSFQMNSQEMATAGVNKVPIKVLIMDNRALGMVRQWQKLFYNERYSHTDLNADIPDFVQLAHAYGWEGDRVENPADLEEALSRMLTSEGPYLLDVVLPSDQNVYPIVAPGKTLGDTMGEIDVEGSTTRRTSTEQEAIGGAR